MKSLQAVAAEWHSGQFSALYAYASSGSVLPGLPAEIDECFISARPLERRDLFRLYVNTAPRLTVQEILANTVFWHRLLTNADGSPVRCRKTGKIKLWVTRPDDFRQPVKYGLKDGFYLTPENIGDWCAPL